MKNLWIKIFLEERPSISFSFFRLAIAFTTGAYVIPTFLPIADNYFSTAFKTYNYHFFTPGFIDFVQGSPDSLVVFLVIIFCVSWFFFLVGLFSQISCVVMYLCCYYFYALNYFALGTLTWDILLVNLFLMCVTPYHGDYFSVDCLRRGNVDAYKRKRPFFMQRLLQLQIASVYFYTGLHKVTGQGNWFTGNPIYNLMNYPPEGVVKNFMIKEFMAGQPELCYSFGVVIVLIELVMPILLFIPRTRVSAIYLGFVFHVTLILTLDVPAIFFFLFPAQLLLFVRPESVIQWIEQKQRTHQKTPSQLVFDGNCQFCQKSVRTLKVMDIFTTLKMVDYQKCDNIKMLHPELTQAKAHSQLHLIEPDGTLHGGFEVFRRLCFTCPMLYVTIPVVYFPGAGFLGPIIYRWVANNRYLFHFHHRCRNNSCFR